MLIILALAAFAATFLGGFFAIKSKDKLHLILGFSAGAVIAVAFFDLIPEALELGKSYFALGTITSFTALGFVIFMLLDRFVIFHSHASEGEEHDGHDHSPAKSAEHFQAGKHKNRGKLGASSLSIHSFLDGVAIGLAFQISAAVGAIVAVAVLVHDFSDGINTVNLVLKNGGTKRDAFKWLWVDALAPVLGIFSTLFFSLPEQWLAVMLAVFAGFFLYIGASDLLPESHHAHPTLWTSIATVLGVAVLYTAIKLAGV